MKKLVGFGDYVAEQMLVEKVSDKEYREARKDKNIRIGMEFEVVNAEFAGGGSGGYDMSQVESDYESYVESIVDFGNELVSSREEWEEEMNEKRNAKRDEHQEEYDRIEQEITDLEDEIDGINATIQELEGKIEENQRIEEDTDDLEDELSGLQSELEEAEEKLDDLRADLDNAELDVQKYEDMSAAEYADEEGEYEWDGVAPPYFDAGTYEDWLEYASGESLPDSSDIVEKVYELTEWGFDSISFSDVTNSSLFEYLPYPTSDYYADEEFDTDSESFRDLVDDVMKGKEPDVGDYHGSSNYSNWRVETDSSLNSGGAEIISPVLNLDDGLEALENMFDWIDSYADTDSSTGFHINMSFDGYDMSKFDWLKLLMFVEEGAIYKEFSDRKDNSYARSIKSYLSGVQNSPENIGSKEYFEVLSKNGTEGMNKVKSMIGSGKFFGVNFSSIAHGSKHGRIEFRYMGGRYHKKQKQVLKQILQYAAWMKIALDPKYKRKEYIKKLAKIASDVGNKNTERATILSGESLGMSHGSSGDIPLYYVFDTSKKMFIGHTLSDKILVKFKFVQAMKDVRLKTFLLTNGYNLKKLLKGVVSKEERLSKKYMADLKAANPEGKITKKEMDKFILGYKQ